MDYSSEERPSRPDRLLRIQQVEGLFEQVPKREDYREVAEYLVSLEERIERLEEEESSSRPSG